MSMGEVGWTVFLTGLPFAAFLFRPLGLDLWYGQAAWADAWIGLLFVLSVTGTNRLIRPNRPLGLWAVWVWGWTWWMWTVNLKSGHEYPVALLTPLLHCLSVLVGYHAFLMHMNQERLGRVLRWMGRVSVIVLAYSLLQLANLDQFLRNIDGSVKHDVLVGTIGNTSHFAAYLALTLPILLLQKGLRWKAASAVNVGLLVLSQSAGGQLAAGVACLWMAWHWHRKVFVGLLACIPLTIITIILTHHVQENLNPRGRLEAWRAFYEIFSRLPITGAGTGFVMLLSERITEGVLFKWRHVHNEWFQIAIEQGIIGLGCVLWAFYDAGQWIMRLPKSPLLVCLSAILLAFGINSLVNFPAHLWLLSSLGLVSYCGIYVIANEEWAEELVK